MNDKLEKKLRDKALEIVERFPFNQCDADCSDEQWKAVVDMIATELINAWQRKGDVR